MVFEKLEDKQFYFDVALFLVIVFSIIMLV